MRVCSFSWNRSTTLNGIMKYCVQSFVYSISKALFLYPLPCEQRTYCRLIQVIKLLSYEINHVDWIAIVTSLRSVLCLISICPFLIFRSFSVPHIAMTLMHIPQSCTYAISYDVIKLLYIICQVTNKCKKNMNFERCFIKRIELNTGVLKCNIVTYYPDGHIK